MHKCWNCGKNVRPEEYDYDWDIYHLQPWLAVNCPDCGAAWTLVFDYSHSEDFTDPDGKEVKVDSLGNPIKD